MKEELNTISKEIGINKEAQVAPCARVTNFTFNVVHPTEEYCKQQEKMGIMNGWGSVFDRLETFVSSSK